MKTASGGRPKLNQFSVANATTAKRHHHPAKGNAFIMTSNQVSASVNAGLTRSLAEIAEEINQHHDQFAQHGQKALEYVAYALDHARTAGELLLEAKRNIQHGGWLDWLSQNCRVGDRQARKYMALASADPNIITEAIAEGLTIDRAVARIAASKKRPNSEPSAPVKKPNRNCDSDLTTAQRSPAPEPVATLPEPQSVNDAWSERMEHLLKHDRREAALELGEDLRRWMDSFREFIVMAERGLAQTGGDRWPDGFADSVRQGSSLAKEIIEMEPFSDGFWLRCSMFAAIKNHVIPTQARKK